MAREGGRFGWRLALFALVLAVGTAGIVFRLVQIQILHHEVYKLRAEDEHLEKRVITSTRGAILDRNGFPLAASIDVFDVYADRRAWHSDPTGIAQGIAVEVAPLLGKSVPEVLTSLLDDREGPISLFADGVDYDIGRQIEEKGLRGISVVHATRRFYPEGDVASGLLGFLGRDHAGLAGLEADLDDTLSGTPAAVYFERDSVGQPIVFGATKVDPGRPGADVRLTIDRFIQRLVDAELDAQIKANGATGGTIIVMDPQTGAILAMASRPSFKLSQLSLDDGKLDLYRSRAVTDVYEPGSVMKTITMAATIDLGLVNPNTTYYDAGVVQKGGFTFRNWDFSVNGVTTMTQLMQKSLNTGAIWLSDQLGPDNLYAYVQKFGFGESTHSGLGGEAAGLIRTNKDAGWYPSDLATNSYGQGIAATPLQVITAISAVINGGRLMRPYIVQEVDSPGNRRIYEPVIVRRVISEASSRTMVKMLNDVVDGVQYHRAQVKGYHVGGKTGTTLVSIPTGYALDSTLATFVGFAPVEDPAFVMLVKLDQPKEPLGGIVAAPVFGKLAPSILAYLNVPPSGIAARTSP